MNIISKEDSNPPHTVSETPPYSKPITINTNIFIPSTSSDSIIKPFEVLDETLKGTIDFEPSSPSRILKEGEQWINSEVGDYSLSSLLGHLESPVKSETNILNDDSRMSQDVDAQLRSMLTQNSVDFSSNFAELAAQVARDKRNDIGWTSSEKYFFGWFFSEVNPVFLDVLSCRIQLFWLCDHNGIKWLLFLVKI